MLPNQTKGLTITGWVFTGLVAALMIFSAIAKFQKSTEVMDLLVKKAHYPESAIFWIGITQLCCTAIFLVPRTAVLGAVLVTGYLGGAVATNVIIGEAWLFPALFGAAAWGGIFFRCPRLRALLPLRS